MAGPFTTLAEKRAHEMSTRAVSLDTSAKAARTAPASANNTPVHHSSDAIATAAAVTLINSARNKNGGSSTPTNYFRPAHSQISFGKLNFLITHMPTDAAIEPYISDLERHHAKTLVRVCEPSYSSEPLREHGIKLFDWQFDDGSPPPTETIQKFLLLCIEVFNSGNDAIALHCVAGLGRAPILVAIALLEAGMKCDDAIFLIRSQRRGALNDKQLEFLRQYKPTGRLRKLRYVNCSEAKKRMSCAIM